jgi:hypothetical protein
MVGQGGAPTDQTKEKIAQASAVEIARLERLARNTEKVVGKNTCHHETRTMISPALMKKEGMAQPSGAPPQVLPTSPS